MQHSTLEPNLDRYELFYLWPLAEGSGTQITCVYVPAGEMLTRKVGIRLRAAARRIHVRDDSRAAWPMAARPELVPARARCDRTPLLQMPGGDWSLPRLTALAERWRTEAGLAPEQHEKIARLFRAAAFLVWPVPLLAAAGRARRVDRRHRGFRVEQPQRPLRVLCHRAGLDAPQPGNSVASDTGLSLRRMGPARPVLPGSPVARPRLGRGLSRSGAGPAPRSAAPIRGDGLTAVGCGWTERRPTSLGTTAANSTTLGAWEARFHAIQHYWERYIADMDNEKQQESVYEPVRRAMRETHRPAFQLEHMAGDVRRRVGTPWPECCEAVSWESCRRGLLLIAVAFVRLVAAWRLTRLATWLWRRLFGRDGSASAKARASVEFYRRFEQVAAGYGLAALAGQTPREFARAAGARLVAVSGRTELAVRAEQVAEAFYVVRFGRQMELDAAATRDRPARIGGIESGSYCMKIGLVGYQGSGKSTVFEWLTGQKPDPALAHTSQSAMAVIPEPRVEGLCGIYKPKKVTLASLEIVDTPGLSRSHEGSAARLALIREAGCLVLVIGAFSGSDPKADLETFDADLILADMEIVTNRIARVAESLRKPLPKQERETLEHEHATLKTVLAASGSKASRCAKTK